MEKIIERFIRYTKIHTTSDPKSESFPSTERQLYFARQLEQELRWIGLSDVKTDEYGYVTATLSANTDKKCPVVGFIAHIDTSPDFSGENVSPRLIENYQGRNIQLSNDGQVELRPEMFPELLKYIGQDLLVTDGKTLLGADDKAGIAEIVSSMEYLHTHPEVKHGKIRICFTPDEEIGKGADHFDVKAFGADFAYTLDGGEIGELEYENFNAAGAIVTIRGRSVHPGYAKDKMINAVLVANQIVNFLPSEQRPEHTEKYEGFYHITSMEGNVSEARIEMIIRDHDLKKFEARKNFLKECCSLINLEYGEDVVQLQLEDQYYNMKQKIEPVKYVVDIAEQAMREVGVEPKIKAIRGGTDGARLSYMGLPCPNIFAGGHNFHGPYEYLPVQSMKKATEVIIRICELVAESR
ncbi:MAG: peptidase T [Bacteroidetes bacterium GWF2_42_66]|nr:MAG: peptidase T [Bacteroidetes bacterium GWA2_42_15]OFY02639.1 MAG: peptidase T [Bacteroidetes bacterium GWE2_42_39]OFY41469.1 MAG: peptidase T [Bacteroidetes bacterium GWF2_42_66]HBL75423.1 peptidase T [Prolixibacteraceae bacterium]HCR91311.1 peptidase T [Prolixibacteraceae bacterium]